MEKAELRGRIEKRLQALDELRPKLEIAEAEFLAEAARFKATGKQFPSALRTLDDKYALLRIKQDSFMESHASLRTEVNQYYLLVREGY